MCEIVAMSAGITRQISASEFRTENRSPAEGYEARCVGEHAYDDQCDLNTCPLVAFMRTQMLGMLPEYMTDVA